MKRISILFFALISIFNCLWANTTEQESIVVRTLKLYSGDSIVYQTNYSQIDSIVFAETVYDDVDYNHTSLGILGCKVKAREMETGKLDGEHKYTVCKYLSAETFSSCKDIIVGIRAAVPQDGKDFSVFIGQDYNNPEYIQQAIPTDDGYQYVLFDTPFPILTNTGYYIGYTVTSDKVIVGSGGCTSKIYIDGENIGDFAIPLNAIAMVDMGIEPVYAMSIEGFEFSNKAYRVGDVIGDIKFYVVNTSDRPVTEFSVTTTVGQQSVTVDTTLTLLHGQSCNIAFPSLTLAEEGETELVVSVDGYTNADAKVTKDIKVLPTHPTTTFKRNCVLSEMFLAQWCPHDPNALEHVGSILTEMPNADKVVSIHHHSGYRSDDFTLQESWEIARFIGVQGVPSGVMNRNWMESDNYTTHPMYYTVQMFEDALAEPAQATLNVTHTFDADTRELTVNISGQSVMEVNYITAVVTQSGIVAPQSGANGSISDFVHNNIPRLFLSAAEGDSVAVDEQGNYSKEYKCTIPESVGQFDCVLEDMEVVVLVHASMSDLEGYVYNADKIDIVPNDNPAPAVISRSGINKKRGIDLIPQSVSVATE